eukprot:GHVT01015409.1.p1 GENE.GHVT01015409.1~~GHVT01015409.1.p1  ORF type:complete len:444 (+),score=56.00 GHVT01015409.1:911-2242(+)
MHLSPLTSSCTPLIVATVFSKVRVCFCVCLHSISPWEHSVVLVDYPQRPPSHFSKVGELFFELLTFASLKLVDASLGCGLGLCNSLERLSTFTAVIVDIGTSITRITPLLSGVPVADLAVALPLGAKDLDQVVLDELHQQENAVPKSDSKHDFTKPVKAEPSCEHRKQLNPTTHSHLSSSLSSSSPSCFSTAASSATAGGSFAHSGTCDGSSPSASIFRDTSCPLRLARSLKEQCLAAVCVDLASSGGGIYAGSDAMEMVSFEAEQARESPMDVKVGASCYRLGSSRVLAPELFFCASSLEAYRAKREKSKGYALNTRSCKTLPIAIHDVVQLCPIDLKRTLLRNIYILGPTAIIPNFMKRLQSELQVVVGGGHMGRGPMVQVHRASSIEVQAHAAFCGAFRLAASHDDSGAIMRTDYEEQGPQRLRSFSLRGRFHIDSMPLV